MSELFLEKMQKWSGKVKEKWEAPEGFFEKSAITIARGLKEKHDSLKSAMAALNFYINRAGSNLELADKERLETAKVKLRKMYGEVKSESLNESKD